MPTNTNSFRFPHTTHRTHTTPTHTTKVHPTCAKKTRTKKAKGRGWYPTSNDRQLYLAEQNNGVQGLLERVAADLQAGFDLAVKNGDVAGFISIRRGEIAKKCPRSKEWAMYKWQVCGGAPETARFDDDTNNFFFCVILPNTLRERYDVIIIL